VLLNWLLPDADSLETTGLIRQCVPNAKVVIVDTFEHDPEGVYRAIRAGATGFLARSDGFETLVAALRQVAQGQIAIPAESLSRLVGFIAEPPGSGHAKTIVEPLSRREEEVLELVAQGKSNREIAELLFIAESTARSHLHHILAKLGLTSRVQAAMYVLERRHQTTSRAGRRSPATTAAA
jgi:DNA-binding NarL/FixJ family response regulator